LCLRPRVGPGAVSNLVSVYCNVMQCNLNCGFI